MRTLQCIPAANEISSDAVEGAWACSKFPQAARALLRVEHARRTGDVLRNGILHVGDTTTEDCGVQARERIKRGIVALTEDRQPPRQQAGVTRLVLD